tara:strand:- start:647 stop:934 length:288 start_codon:yes stop_codon:yes gene_type:complete
MADSVTGVKVFTLAQLKTIGAGANVIGDTGIDGVVRDRWNARAVVAVSDHPADGGDGNERAIFVQNSLNNVWRLGGAKRGGQTGDKSGPQVVIPE